MIPDMPGPVTTAQTAGDPDEVEFDPMPYLRLLWRRRSLVLLVTFGFGACALGVSLLMPKRYEATARIYVGEPGSPGYSQTIGKVRILAQDPGVAAQVLKSPEVASSSTALTLTQLHSATTARDGTPPNIVLITVTLGDAELASRAAAALAARTVDAFRQQSLPQVKQGEPERLQAALVEARKAVRDFTVTKRMLQRRQAQEIAKALRLGLSQTLVEIATEVVRLKAAEGQAAAASIRIMLAGLEARRSYLVDEIARSENNLLLQQLADDEVELRKLEVIAVIAERDNDAFIAAFNGVGPASASVADSAPPVSEVVTDNTARNVGTSLAMGLLVSILVVIAREKLAA